ncbi:MAG: sigma-70 family RNA polymerase sigma factor [Clostridia bacterium]|nr:sigma-70 family RNA polymerase sigma factor [Clostridia bacterium]
MAIFIENGVYKFSDSGLPCEMTEEVVRHYSDMVMRLALTKTQSSYDADDIFQEVFIKLFEAGERFESEEHRKAWILRVAINACNSHFTAPWKKNISSFDDVLENQLAYVDEDWLAADTRNDIYARVLKLPQKMKDVILFYYYEELSIKEIALLIDDSEANVKKRLSRARQKLRLELENDEYN